MTSNAVDALDRWIRSGFRTLNTELENLYFAQPQRHAIEGVGERTKSALVSEGRRHVIEVLAEGHSSLGSEEAFNLLGCVGLYMAACRRHEVTEPSRESISPLREASTLAHQVALSLGVSPRFTSNHLGICNRATDGVYRSFTFLEEEFLFLEYNTLGTLAYQRAADCLRRVVPLGISHPLAGYLFDCATAALADVATWNDRLYDDLDVDRFFHCVRPYYKSYRVGHTIYRGANAGDFSGINIIDLLLGLCRGDDLAYAEILADKFPFLIPAEQEMLKDCMRRRSFLDEFLQAAPQSGGKPWFRRNLRAFLHVLEVHGRTASQHHDRLVKRFIEGPATQLPQQALTHITASGPPLSVLLKALERLRDLRLAADRSDIPTRFADLQKLEARLLPECPST